MRPPFRRPYTFLSGLKPLRSDAMRLKRDQLDTDFGAPSGYVGPSTHHPKRRELRMALFQASQEQLDEGKRKLVEQVTPHTGGEELLAVGMFRRGGFGASYAASKMGGGLLYAGVNLARKKRAGGLPDRLMLAVTPSTLYAFSWKPKRSSY